MILRDSSIGRFYSAFYRWTIHTARPQHQARHLTSSTVNPHLCPASRRTAGERIQIRSDIRSSKKRNFTSGQTCRSEGALATRHEHPSEESKQHKQQPRVLQSDHDALSQQLRTTLRQLTQPVVVVTTADARSDSNNLDHLRGMTVSSFNSIALSPVPYICFNIKLPSRTWDAIQTRREILIHILAANAAGVEIAHTFAQPHAHPSYPFKSLAEAGIPVAISKNSQVPELGEHTQVLSRIRAQVLLEKCIAVGDHVLVVAEVTRVTDLKSDGSSPVALSYGAGEYRQSGNAIGTKRSEGDVSISAKQLRNRDAAGSSYDAKVPSTSRAFSSCTRTLARRQSKSALRELVSDPSMLDQTVGHFLGKYPNPDKRPRAPGGMQQLLKLRDEANTALAQLETLLAQGRADSPEAVECERIHDKNSRFVLRTLARRSAADLRDMLDAGVLDHRLADWMEATIEKGQAFLLEETQRLKSAMEGNLIDEERFQQVGRQIQMEYLGLREVTDRLRDFAEDEDN